MKRPTRKIITLNSDDYNEISVGTLERITYKGKEWTPLPWPLNKETNDNWVPEALIYWVWPHIPTQVYCRLVDMEAE